MLSIPVDDENSDEEVDLLVVENSTKSFIPPVQVHKHNTSKNPTTLQNKQTAMDEQGPVLAQFAGIPIVQHPPEYAYIVYGVEIRWKQLFYRVLSCLSIGVLPIICHWWPKLYFNCNYDVISKCALANYALLYNKDCDSWDIVQIHRQKHGGSIVIQWFEYRKLRYLYDPYLEDFKRVASIWHERAANVMDRVLLGWDSSKVNLLQHTLGLNIIDIMETLAHILLIQKIMHPFYLFQIASVLIWIGEEYYTYSILILIMSVISILHEVYSQLINTRKLRSLVSIDYNIKVTRNNVQIKIPATELVVGDIVVLEKGLIVADIVLLTGECTMDESSLTGEAIPVNKLPVRDLDMTIDPSIKDIKKESFLYSGSLVMQLSSQCFGVVVSTGFHTNKGDLFRTILFPKPIKFKVQVDSYRFLVALTVVAIIAGIKNAIEAAANGIPFGKILLSSLDLITVAVPPALPLVLTVGVGLSMARLQQSKIYCIDPQRINICGHVDVFCFDKTGTLTSEKMEFQGVDESREISFTGIRTNANEYTEAVLLGLASCHGLTESNNKFTGYPLELDMFQHSKYSYETNIEHNQTKYNLVLVAPVRYESKKYGILRRFPFDASLQLSSVVLTSFGSKDSNTLTIFTKGSPEAIESKCSPSSIPANYRQIVQNYSKRGYYCLGIATKVISRPANDTILRPDIESNLHFLGFILFLNKIKPESVEVIKTLQDAGISARMITGDNALTAIYVSRQVSFQLQDKMILIDTVSNELQYQDVDGSSTNSTDPNCTWKPFDADSIPVLKESNEFTITGHGLEYVISHFQEDVIDTLILHIKIFARIKPNQKTWIIETLMKLNKKVGMCGDGTNDCGALKAAHIGLALSNADASIVAPFTSNQKQITDILTLVREGRCALTTSFLAFKYMIMYPVIQVIMLSTLYGNMGTLSNNQFLFDDMVIVLGLSVLMLYTEPETKLSKQFPAKTLFAPAISLSLLGHILLFIIFYAIAYSMMKDEDWFCSLPKAREIYEQKIPLNSSNCYQYNPPPHDGYSRISYENAVTWLFGHVQFIIVALVFNMKDPFRQYFYSNTLFTSYLLFISLLAMLFLFTQSQTVLNTFDLINLPSSFRFSLFVLVIINVICAIGWEYIATRKLHTLGGDNDELTPSNAPKYDALLQEGEKLDQNVNVV